MSVTTRSSAGFDPDPATQHIPRVFHRVWLGPAAMPDTFRAWGDRWLELNPGYEMRLWTDKNLPEIVNRDVFDAFKNYAGKSDVLRFELLYQFGGIYLDTDFEPLRPLGDLFDGITSFWVDECPGSAATGIIGARKRDPFYAHLIEALPRSFREQSDHVQKAGPPFFQRETDRFFGSDRMIAQIGRYWRHSSRDGSRYIYGLEQNYFYPYTWREMHRRNEDFAKTSDAYAVHHWAHSW